MGRTLSDGLVDRGWSVTPADQRHKRLASIAPHGDAQWTKGPAIISLSNGALYSGKHGVTYFSDPGLVLNAILIEPDHRGLRLGRDAMADLLAAGSEIGSDPFYLYVEAVPIGGIAATLNGQALREWYERLGFESYDGSGPSCLRIETGRSR